MWLALAVFAGSAVIGFAFETKDIASYASIYSLKNLRGFGTKETNNRTFRAAAEIGSKEVPHQQPGVELFSPQHPGAL